MIAALIVVLSECGGISTTAGGGSGAAGGGGAADDVSFSSRGDATRGEQVFTQCAACHSTGTNTVVGPGLAGVFGPGGPMLPDGVNYNGALSNGQPITEPNVAAWIKNGGQGKIGVMTPQTLTDQQLADVIAYLRTLRK